MGWTSCVISKRSHARLGVVLDYGAQYIVLYDTLLQEFGHRNSSSRQGLALQGLNYLIGGKVVTILSHRNILIFYANVKYACYPPVAITQYFDSTLLLYRSHSRCGGVS